MHSQTTVLPRGLNGTWALSMLLVTARLPLTRKITLWLSSPASSFALFLSTVEEGIIFQQDAWQ